jgi:alanine dehydrogenase
MTTVPVFTGKHVEQAVSPDRAVEAVRAAFIAYARGEWTMPPKVYVTNYPAGDFRAMPALGAGHALLKWVTSFPGNPLQGLPTVTGVVLVSDAENGQLRAVLDAASVTALRTGAAAVLAAETLGRADSVTASVIGAGVNGRAAARTFLARGRPVTVWDVNEGRAKHVAQELGAQLAPSLEEALAADLLVTVTPGHEVLIGEGTLRPGQHVSLMGADGPGKSEMAGPELARARLFCDDWEQAGTTAIPEPKMRLFIDEWEQASHSGEIAQVVASGQITRDDVTQLGDVLAGTATGREADSDITLFDSTGLAIQDLAIALAAIENASELIDLPTLDL